MAAQTGFPVAHLAERSEARWDGRNAGRLMPEFLTLCTLDEARRRLAAALPPFVPRSETLALAESLGRVAFAPIRSPEDVPPFARSTVDGFAVRSQDVWGASEGAPAYLAVIGEVAMGRPAAVTLGPNQAARIPTGGMLPVGADAALMVERTQPWGDDGVEVLSPVAPGENVVSAAEDVRAGDDVLEAGRLIGPAQIGALAAVGVTQVAVRRRPVVVVASTGNELVPPEEKPPPGRIRDINLPVLSAQVRQAGGEPRSLGILGDDAATIEAALRQALPAADMLAVSGGTSVGSEDVVVEVLARLGEPGILVHGLAIKPGKPTAIAVLDGKPAFALPGHPVSCAVVFDLLCAGLVRRMAGLPDPPARRVQARLARPLASAPGREDFYRVRLEEIDGELQAVPLLGKSALISTLARADGLVRVPLEAEGLDAGELVEVLLLYGGDLAYEAHLSQGREPGPGPGGLA